MRTAKTVLEVQQIMNVYFHNLRVGGTTDYAIKMYNQCGIVFWNEGGIDGNMNTQGGENWRLRQKGMHISNMNSLVIRNTNMWTLSDVITIEGYCTHLTFDTNWVEMCKDIFIYNVSNNKESKNLSIISRDNMYLQNPWNGNAYNFRLFEANSNEDTSTIDAISEGLFTSQNDKILFNRDTGFQDDCLIYLNLYNGSLNFSISNLYLTRFEGVNLPVDFKYIRASNVLLNNPTVNFKVNVLNFSTTSSTAQIDKLSNVPIENLLEQGRKNFAAITAKRIKLTQSNPSDFTGCLYYADFNKSMRMHRTSTDIVELVNIRKGVGSPIGAIAPDFIGQMYVDETPNSESVYISIKMGNTGWVKINN